MNTTTLQYFCDTIVSLAGESMIGLWILAFASGRAVPISSGTGVRELARAFGASDVAGDLFEKIYGQDIIWSLDEMGLVMAAFTPVDEWSGPYVEPGCELTGIVDLDTGSVDFVDSFDVDDGDWGCGHV